MGVIWNLLYTNLILENYSAWSSLTSLYYGSEYESSLKLKLRLWCKGNLCNYNTRNYFLKCVFIVYVFMYVWISLKRVIYRNLIILTLGTTVIERNEGETLLGDFMVTGRSSASWANRDSHVQLIEKNINVDAVWTARGYT